MNIKTRVNDGRSVLGIMVSELSGPSTVTMLSTAGLDFFIIDMEHGPFTYKDMAGLISAARGVGLDPVVRIPEIRRETVLKPLDAGATTLVAPQVEEVEEIQELVHHAMYPGVGRRGVALRRGHSRYAKNPPVEYMQQANEDTMILAQIESARGLENIEALAAVPGLGGFFIGPFDLSVDLGEQGDTTGPTMRDAYRRVISVAQKYRLPTAIQLFDPSMAPEMIKEGISICSFSSDINIIVDHTASLIENIRD